MLRETIQMEKDFPYLDWSMIWEARKKFFDKRFLGELNDWDGIRPERVNLFMDKGVLF